MNEWKNIWNKETRISKIILEMLIKVDGFGNANGNFCVDDWITYTNNLYQKMSLTIDDSIYDVGCGSGAFLYPLYLKGYKVGGIDYSSLLIDLAEHFLSSAFEHGEAVNINCEPYNVVVSHSVFQYFENLEYAEKVIHKMLKKASKKIAILDINDVEKKKEYHKIRQSYISKENHKGLLHMFYSKEWFYAIAEKMHLTIDVFDQSFDKYINSKLRFNVIMKK